MKKFTKIFVSIFTTLALTLPVLFTACGKTDDGDKDKDKDKDQNQVEAVDYAGTVSLDFASSTKKQEVTVKLYIDGDTTHFDPITNSTIATNPSSDFSKTQGYIKARYLAVNTPEITGAVEPWGQAAAKFTRGKLENAQSIVVESDDDKWNIDSTGERYTLWIWYKPQGETEYRNLNLEILQAGLALGSNAAGNRYGSVATKVLEQARSLQLYVFSKEKDPDYPYGEAKVVTLKELRCHLEDYNGKKVRAEGVIAAEFGHSVYIEDYDTETDSYFGISVYYGFNATPALLEIFKIGNRVSVVGVVSY
ncbi:MAG: thermonuclease family protein, partial [Clostridia bacterium]|nr:thermonuclease family protein [Clostridia bacterium]